jgi:hypothetical protein
MILSFPCKSSRGVRTEVNAVPMNFRDQLLGRGGEPALSGHMPPGPTGKGGDLLEECLRLAFDRDERP